MAAPPLDDLSEISDGTPLTEIAVRYGVSVGTARRWLTNMTGREQRSGHAASLSRTLSRRESCSSTPTG